MNVQPQLRKCDRIGHEAFIKFEDRLTLSSSFAVSYNLSETGLYFESLFKVHPGVLIHIRIDNHPSSQISVPAVVVWCNKLKNMTDFKYGVGVRFLQTVDHIGVKALPAMLHPMRPPLAMLARRRQASGDHA